MPNLYLTAVLIPCKKKRSPDLDVHVHSQLTVGRTVSSLYQFRDLDDIEKYFFVFSDLSIRAEGRYRFKLTLFEITGLEVQFRADIDTDEFTVYSAKKFPGMFGSCHLARSFARQGLKIRIRKASEPRKRRVRTTIDPIFQYQGVFNVHDQPPGPDDDDDDEIDDDDDERDGSSASSLDDDAPHDPPIPDTAHRPTNDR
ncbi:velvet factor-domain-containing protein [Gongronella butleri]|nr:velvet factor-domain-containing protein [Gongronella butleri]